MNKAPLSLLILVALALLTLTSCESMLKNYKLGKPETAFIAVGTEFYNGNKRVNKEIIEVHLENPLSSNRHRSFSIGKKRNTKQLVYDFIPLKPGTYKLDRIAQYKEKSDYLYYWNLPAKDSYVFKINPGEVFYIGDYKIDASTTPDTLILSSNMDECKDTLVARHPELDGFVWLTPDIERSPF